MGGRLTVPRPSPGVARVVSVLDFLADRPEETYSLSELCRQVGINKATAHALLGELTDAGYLVRDPVDKTYGLGPRLLAVGMSAGRSERTTINRARPHMRRLATELDVRCVASALRGDELVILEVAGRDRPFRTSLQPGHRVPCAPPIGTVFVAWAAERSVQRWLARAGDDLTEASRSWYLDAVAAARRRGCSLSLDGQARARLEQAMVDSRLLHDAVHELSQEAYLVVDDLDPSQTYPLSHVAAPVFGLDGQVAMALTIYDLPGSLSVDEIDALTGRVRAAARAVTEAVGGTPPHDHEQPTQEAP
jgi:DNA-binding IclR family transcriptional regulator